VRKTRSQNQPTNLSSPWRCFKVPDHGSGTRSARCTPMILLSTFRKSYCNKNGHDQSRNECWRAKRTIRTASLGSASNASVMHWKASTEASPASVCPCKPTKKSPNPCETRLSARYSRRLEIACAADRFGRRGSPHKAVGGTTWHRGIVTKCSATRDPTVGVPPPSLQAALRVIPSLMVCGNPLFSSPSGRTAFCGRCRPLCSTGDRPRALLPGASSHGNVLLQPAPRLQPLRTGERTRGGRDLAIGGVDSKRGHVRPPTVPKRGKRRFRCGSPHHSRQCVVMCSSWSGRMHR
jgi:hypothetical protein